MQSIFPEHSADLDDFAEQILKTCKGRHVCTPLSNTYQLIANFEAGETQNESLHGSTEQGSG